MHSFKTNTIRLTLVLMGLMFTVGSFAANVTSVGSGSWNTPSTWDSGMVPTAADDVTILASHTVNAFTTMNFASLTIDASGVFDISTNTTYNTSGDITNNGTILWNSGDLDGPAGGMTIINNNTFTVVSAALEITSDVNFVNTNGAVFEKPGGGLQVLSGTFDNQAGASINVTIGPTNNTLRFDGGLTNSGSMTVDRTIMITGNLTVNSGSSIGGTGSLLLFNSTINGSGDFAPGCAIFRCEGGTGGDVSVTGSAGQKMIIPSGTDATMSFANIDGFDELEVNGILNFGLASSGAVSFGMDVLNNGTINWNNANLDAIGGGRTLTNAGIFSINISGKSLTDIDFVNQSGANFIKTVGGLQTISTNFDNQAGATVTVNSGATNNTLEFTGTLINNGSVVNDRSVRLNGTTQGNGSFDGSVAPNVFSGSLEPGSSPGCLTFNAGIDFRGTYVAEVNGTTACTAHDQLIINGNFANDAGSVLEANVGSFAPATGTQIKIVDASSISGSGSFGTVNFVPASAAADWSVVFDFPNSDVFLQYNGLPAGDLEFVVGTPTSGPNNTVVVPVSVNNFNSIASYQASIGFDPAVLTYVSAASPDADIMNTVGAPGQGSVPNDYVVFSWFDPNGMTTTKADGTVVLELTFTVDPSATTGSTTVEVDVTGGAPVAAGFSDDINGTTLDTPGSVAGGVTVDADPPTVDVISIASDNADPAFAKVGDVITISFTTSETPDQTPVVVINEGGAGAVTVSGSGTSWTATKTVAAGGDGVTTFSIQVQDEFGNSSTATATTDASQVIVDTVDPSITCPGPFAVNVDDAATCGATVNFADATATDANAVSVAQTAGSATGSLFPVGNSQVSYTATDAAGNTSDCTFDIDVTDNIGPAVTTMPATVTLDANGNGSITVADVEASSSDACGINTKSLSQSTFTCTDAANSPVSVDLTVTDIHGNSTTVAALVTVNADPIIPISGSAASELGLAIPNVTFDINGDDGPLTQVGSSYSFDVNPCNAINDIGADRNNDATLNGINVADAFAVVRHVLLIDPLDTEYQLVAADVNDSDGINVLDAFQIIRRFLGIRSFFNNPNTGANDTRWVFIPSDYVFADPANPWSFDTRKMHMSVPAAGLTGQDFIGVKLGDVNNSWDANPSRIAAPKDSIYFELEQVAAQTGTEIRVPVRLRNFTDISAYQYSMNWDANVLKFKGIEHAAIEAIYNTEEAEQGRIASAWIDMAGQSVSYADGVMAFEMVFEVVGPMGSSTSFEINSSMTEVMAMTADEVRLGVGSGSTIAVGTTSNELELAGYGLGQNAPNPFSLSTEIRFSLGQAEAVEIAIYNTAGQLIKSFSGDFAAGAHSIQWDGNATNGSAVSAGIYLVQMRAGEYTSSVRMSKL